MPIRPARRSPRPPVLRCLAVVLAAASLLAAGCSDAHSQAQRAWDNPGIDPNVITLLAPPQLTPVLNALGQGFLAVRPDTSLVFINDITATSGKYNRQSSRLTNSQIIAAGAAPGLWIDLAAVLKAHAHDSGAQGAILPFGVESMVLTVRAGNPAGVTGLDAFAAGGPSAGRCPIKAPCGKLGATWLQAAKIRPSYELKVRDAPALVDAIAAGKVDAGLVLSLDASGAAVTTVAVASPPAPSIAYRMLAMSPNPTAIQFEKWVATSPEARTIMANAGMLPGSGKGSP
jgi:hypothetical protein